MIISAVSSQFRLTSLLLELQHQFERWLRWFKPQKSHLAPPLKLINKHLCFQQIIAFYAQKKLQPSWISTVTWTSFSQWWFPSSCSRTWTFPSLCTRTTVNCMYWDVREGYIKINFNIVYQIFSQDLKRLCLNLDTLLCVLNTLSGNVTHIVYIQNPHVKQNRKTGQCLWSDPSTNKTFIYSIYFCMYKLKPEWSGHNHLHLELIKRCRFDDCLSFNPVQHTHSYTHWQQAIWWGNQILSRETDRRSVRQTGGETTVQ